MKEEALRAAGNGLIEKVVILGGGTAGWMTASYLKRAFPHLHIALAEAPNIPKIGVGEATIPNLQKVFFDFLGLKEDDWMRRCNAAFKCGIKFQNWRRSAAQDPNDYFYHLFGQIPECDGVPLAQYWALNRHLGSEEPLAYACYKEAPLLDKKLSPRFMNGSRAMYYAWHFDAHLVADYLREIAVGWGVEHYIDRLDSAEVGPDGGIKTLHMASGRKLEGDLFVDCSGFRGLLINKALDEPFVDMSDYLFCDSAVASQVPHDDEKYGVDPYTSSIAMDAGWTWKIPMLGRFGTGYVYSSKFASEDQAVRDFCKLWNLDENKAQLNRIRFRTGRNRRAWVKNCVSIGLASCFLEPLESTGIYFIYAAIYQLAKHFPDKTFNPGLIRSFNESIETMFDESRDFIQAHYCLSSRDDTAFWRANRNDLRLAPDLQLKLDQYRAGLVVNQSLPDVDGYYTNFDQEFRNFWTNSNFYCVLGGLDVIPEQPYPRIRYAEESIQKSELLFKDLKRQTLEFEKKLPSNYEFLKKLHSPEGLGADAVEDDKQRRHVAPIAREESGVVETNVDGDTFRAAMGSLASGVTVVTTKDLSNNPWGLTATAFSSVSADPPLCLVCVHKDARITKPLRESGVFAVNLLSTEQQSISELCASEAVDRLEKVDWLDGRTTGCPVIHDALCTVECVVEEIHSGGDHDIIVGRVRSASSRAGSPLVYWRGSYSSLAPPPSERLETTTIPPLASDIRGLTGTASARQKLG